MAINGKHTTDDSDLGRGLNDLDMLDSLGKIGDGEHYILAFVDTVEEALAR